MGVLVEVAGQVWKVVVGNVIFVGQGWRIVVELSCW